MVDINKRLVEVEAILKKLDITYKNKIPNELWDFLKQNKDKDYLFYYDDGNLLINQQLSTDTVAILTYINMKYLLNDTQKQDIKQILIKDESILEQKKKEKYNPDDLFQNKSHIKEIGIKDTKNELTENLSMVKYKEQKLYHQIFEKLLNIFRKK